MLRKELNAFQPSLSPRVLRGRKTGYNVTMVILALKERNEIFYFALSELLVSNVVNYTQPCARKNRLLWLG